MTIPITKEGYKLFHRGVLALADVEQKGICIDTAYLKLQRKKTEKKIKAFKEEVNKSKLIKTWRQVYSTRFNINSNQQLAGVLFGRMGYEPTGFTEKSGKPSTDEEALTAVKNPTVKKLIRIRKLKRACDRIDDILSETVDGILHPNFNLHLVRTFRSSCNSPNFQNMNVRNPEIAEIIRRGIVARPGRMLVELDYKALEVCIAACYNEDPNLIKEVIDPATDMHTDQALECYALTRKELGPTGKKPGKDVRYCAKNKFVFPEFYGDYYVECAKNLWKSISSMKLETAQGVPLKKHLVKKGIKNTRQYENHIKKVEHRFWNKRFKVYTQWKDDLYKSYLKKGYVDMLTGFRCYEVMKRNEVINRGIQGSAFHCLLWSLIRLNKQFKKYAPDCYIIGQIHDSIILDINPEKFELVIRLAKKVMEKDIRKAWDWIIVPLTVEVEASPVGGSWFEKKEVE